jgi:putative hydrolase of the HAD superfamily
MNMPNRPSLIFDADDTLWENMIYFQHAIEEFLALVRPVEPNAQRVRDMISAIEREFIPVGGYGTRNFVNALKETCRRLHRDKDVTALLRRAEEIGVKLIRHPLDLRPGVAEVIYELHGSYRLLVFSKGDFDEQYGKVRKSGLGAYFEQVVIAGEKDADAYRRIVAQYSLSPARTFMIGNSPRSDIVPALEAGLWAVFLPHPHTWEFEHHDLPAHPRLLRAESIHDLPETIAHVLA